jgi:TolB-like protein/DNA-binding winged helix-turn-helix (wHTH) protein/Tfp pilus assembly protein PilF
MERGIIFGGYRFDRSTGRLWSGKREVRLTPKATAVLGALVTRAGELVTKEELLGSIWRDTAVSDDALTSCVQELRKALGDNAKQPRFIETRHRRGYCFLARVSEATTKEPRADSRSLSRTAMDRSTDLNPDAAGAPGTEARRSETRGRPTVAVLPFNDVSGDTDQEYFTEGITEDIMTALSKHRSLLVIARTSAFAFKGRSIDARRAGMDLGADYVVDGSVDRSGQRLRLRVRLIEADVGRQVWAERYDRNLEDMFEVQDEITAAIAARIEPEVGSIERLRAERKSPEALRAWDFFHLGMKHFYKSTVEDNEEAQRLLRRAIELDPTLAQAYAWLSYAIVLSMIYFDADPDDQRLNAAVVLAKKGVDLDDQDAVTHFGYGRALLAQKAYEGALAELESAAELNPTLAIAYCGLGDSLAYEGRLEEAIPYFDKAISLSPYDPHRWAFYSYRALAHLFAGQFDRALDWAQKATRVPNCHYWPFAHRVSALGHLQQVDATRAAKAELLQRKPEFSCAFARRRLFFIKNPAHLELYVEGLFKAGITP